MTSSSSTRVLLAVIVSLTGCMAAPDDGSTSERSDGIVNGTVRPDGYMGMVRVQGLRRASGTREEFTFWSGGVALRNDWVLTQTVHMAEDPSTYHVTLGAQSVNVDAALAYYVVPNNGGNAQTWAMLLHLSTPLSLNGSTSGYRRQITGVSPVGRSLLCLGYGNGVYSLTSAQTLPLTSGTFVASASVWGSYIFDVRPNASGQSPFHDRGSVCFDGANVAGVEWNENIWNTENGAEYTCGSELARWANAMMSEGVPPNDTRATAIDIGAVSENLNESTVWGSTVGATHDGPSVACACTSGNDIWYRFHVESNQRIAQYFDTAGSSFDTSLTITDANGVPLAGNALSPAGALCNDDAQCTTGGFTSVRQSRIAGVFGAGNYYLVVGGCGAGHVVLHSQRMSVSRTEINVMSAEATTMVEAPLVGTGTVSGITAGGTGVSTSSCGGDGAEVAYWFTTCGGQSEQFSLCQSDGGSYTRRYTNPLTGAYADFDPVLRLRKTPATLSQTCNDDGLINGATNCVGTGGDTSQYGSRVTSTGLSRGLGFVYVDERTAHSVGALYPLGSTRGMSYSMAYSIR